MAEDVPFRHDLAAERAVLGAILIEPAQLDVSAEVLTDPTQFFRIGHQHIYAAMLRLRSLGTAIDYKSVSDALAAAKQHDAGMPLYLAGLVDGVPRAMNVGYYADRVRTLAAERSITAGLMLGVEQIAEQGLTPDVLDHLRAIVSLDAPSPPAVAHERRVSDELGRERARREARRRLDAEAHGAMAYPEFATLADRLARPRLAKQWRIDRFQPLGSRSLTTAKAKTGKTTLTGNRIRSLIDGDAFLGVARVRPLTGTYVLLNPEMGESQQDDWLADQRIKGASRIYPVTLKGCASSFNIIDPVCRAEWAARFRAISAEFLDLDGLRPIFDALGLDEHKQAGTFLVAFDALLVEAGIPDANVTHHMGHSGERARGDSRIQDWPDVEIRMVQPDTTDKASPRFLSAYGRDVDIPESQLLYDPTTRRLTLAGGSRSDLAGNAALDDICALLTQTPAGLSFRKIEAALKESEHSQAAVRQAIKLGSRTHGPLSKTIGPRGSHTYTVNASASVRGTALSVRQHGEPDRVSAWASIEATRNAVAEGGTDDAVRL